MRCDETVKRPIAQKQAVVPFLVQLAAFLDYVTRTELFALPIPRAEEGFAPNDTKGSVSFH
jgi:hypothetical protein